MQRDQFGIEPPPEMTKKDTEPGDTLSLSEAMKRMDMESLLQTGSMATRRAYGIALRALGQVNDKVISALEANSPLGKLLATGLANRHRPRQVLMERS